MPSQKHIAIAATLGLAAFLTACGGAGATQGVMKASQDQKGGFLGLVKKAEVEATTPAAFKGKTKVALGAFTVGFDIEKVDSRKAGGGLLGNGMGGKSSAYSKLTGLDNDTLAAITEAAYGDFVQKLKSAGYEIVEPSAVLSDANFSGTKTLDNPLIQSSGGIMTAKNETRYFTPAAFGKNRSFGGSIPGEMGGFAFANPGMGAAKYAEATHIPVLHVTYKLDFANAGGHGSKWSSSSSVQVGQGLTAEAGVTKLGIIGGQSGSFSSTVGSLALGQPISSDKPFAEVADSTTGTDKGLQVATNIIGVIGGVGTNSKRNYEFKAEPSKYKAAALDVLEQTNANFVAKMQSLR